MSLWHIFECLCMRWILSCQKWQKKWGLRLFRHNRPQLGLFHPYFVSKSCFKVISIIKTIILDQSKPISLMCEKIKSYCKNPKFVHSTFIIHKNGNKTSIQSILKSNSTYFMFNNSFCDIKDKKVTHWGGLGGNGGTVLISS